MLIDAHTLPADTVLEADVCIIGAGAAGLTLARALSSRGLEVLVLESGGLERDNLTQDLYAGENVGRPYHPLDAARSRYLGGSTNCWAGLCAPLAPIDFEARDWVPHSGWPFDRAHLDPFYARAQVVLGVGPFAYAADDWRTDDQPPLDLAGPLESGLFQLSAPVRMGTAWRADLEQRADLRVVLNASVRNLDLNASGATLDGVSVQVLGGPALSARARRYVLATGGIENARLLLSADDVQPEGIGNAHDLVGRYFMEHPHTDYEGLLVGSPHLRNLDYYRRHTVRGQPIWGLFRAPDAVLRAERILNFSIVLFSREDAGRTPPPLFEAMGPVVAQTDAPSLPPSADAPLLFTLGTPSESAPNPDSRVRLGADRDALGMRRAELDWRLSPLDKRTIRRAHELLGQTFAQAGLGRLRVTLTPDEQQWPDHTNGGFHHMGTTRMHPDPRQGVVDAQGYVHGVDNLLVAGSSVFPTGGAANPTLTIVALALRMADHLAEVLA